MKNTNSILPAALRTALVAATMLALTTRAGEHNHDDHDAKAKQDGAAEVCHEDKPAEKSECCEAKAEKCKPEKKSKKDKHHKQKRHAAHQEGPAGCCLHGKSHTPQPHPAHAPHDMLMPRPPFHTPPGPWMERRPFHGRPAHPTHAGPRPPGHDREARRDGADHPAARMEQKFEEQERRIRHMAEAANHLEASGHREHVERLRDSIRESEQDLVRAREEMMRNLRGEEGRMPRELQAGRERLEHLAEAIKHLKAAGLNEPANELAKQLAHGKEELRRAMEKAKRGPNGHGENHDRAMDETRRNLEAEEQKLEHMKHAAKNLEAAGLKEPAQQLRGEIERKRQQLGEAIEQAKREHHGQAAKRGDERHDHAEEHKERHFKAEQENLRHLGEAAERLQAAGMEEAAKHVREQMAQMRRAIGEAMERAKHPRKE